MSLLSGWQSLLSCFLFCWLALWPGIAHSDEYTVKGTVRYETVHGVKLSKVFDFTTTVSNCLWAIEAIEVSAVDRSSQTEPYPAKGIVRVVDGKPTKDLIAVPLPVRLRKVRHSFDGSQVASTVFFPQTIFTTNRSAQIEGRDGLLQLENNDTPNPEEGGIVASIWLALASSCHLDQISDDHLQPVWPIERKLRLTHFSVPASFQRTDDPKGLPRNVDFFFDEADWNASASTKAPRSSKRRRDNSILWASYSGSKFTNYFGENFRKTIPGAFTLTVFEPFRELVKTGDRLPVCRVVGEITEVGGGVETSLIDQRFIGVAQVVDLRLTKQQQLEGIIYPITNSIPPSADRPDLALLQAREDAYQASLPRSGPPDTNTFRFLVILALVGVTGTFVWLIARSARNNYNPNKSV